MESGKLYELPQPHRKMCQCEPLDVWLDQWSWFYTLCRLGLHPNLTCSWVTRDPSKKCHPLPVIFLHKSYLPTKHLPTKLVMGCSRVDGWHEWGFRFTNERKIKDFWSRGLWICWGWKYGLTAVAFKPQQWQREVIQDLHLWEKIYVLLSAETESTSLCYMNFLLIRLH